MNRIDNSTLCLSVYGIWHMKQAPVEKGKCVARILVLETCEMNIINKKQHWRDVKDVCIIVLKSCLLKLIC